MESIYVFLEGLFLEIYSIYFFQPKRPLWGIYHVLCEEKVKQEILHKGNREWLTTLF